MLTHEKNFIHEFIFLKNLKKTLNKKNILLDESRIYSTNCTITLILNSFFRYKKIQLYNKKKKILNFTTHFKLSHFISKQFKLFNINVNIIKIKNLNKYINFKYVKIFSKSFKRFRKTLFIRRLDLFQDFLKLSALTIKAKIKPSIYLFLFAQIFTTILKKKHGQFLFFIKAAFKKIIVLKKTHIKGIKFFLNGKIKGKPRANSFKLLLGNVPCQQVNSKIEYSKINTYNRYGAFGFKLWLNYY